MTDLQQEAMTCAHSGAQYLNNQITKSGKFIYARDSMGLKKKGKYNMLRHAGAVWALSTLGKSYKLKFSNHPLALDYLMGKVKLSGNRDEFTMACMVDKGITKLGGNALTMLALEAEHTITIDLVKSCLTMGIKFWVHCDGSFTYHKINLDTQEPSDFISEYYPGEVVLALTRYKSYELAYKICNNLFEKRDSIGGDPHMSIHDHWLLQGLSELYTYFSDVPIRQGWLASYMYAIKELMMKEPQAYLERACPLACRLEGLIAMQRAYPLNSTLDFITMLIPKLWSYQQSDVKHPAYGAFIDHNEYRIDYTQHAICALHAYSQLEL